MSFIRLLVLNMKGIGQLLLDKKIITQAQLDNALSLQVLEPGKYLGQILCEMGTPQFKIIKALYYNHKRKSIGQILLDLKIISLEQLNKALTEQKRLRSQFGFRKPLCGFLVELGIIDQEEYLTALSVHFNMPVISLQEFDISTALQKAFGEKYTYHHKIIVVQNNPNIIKVAIAEPNIFLMEELEKALPPGKDIFFYLARLSEIDMCFEKKYDPFEAAKYR